MPNHFLSGRIDSKLFQQVEEYLARSGESKTEMLTKAVAAYIGAEIPSPKGTGDRRVDLLEQEVAELKGAVKSLYEKFTTLTPRIESPKGEIEPIVICDNSIDNNDNTEEIDNTVNNSDNHVGIEEANSPDNTSDNGDNLPEVTCHTEPTSTIDDDKNFIKIDTTKAARITKLDAKRFTDLRGSFNRKLKKDHQSLPERQILDCPIKMTPSSGVTIEKIPYDIFYVGQSKDGRNLWNLIPKESLSQPIQLTFVTDNN
jgi:hypothetical protein